MSLSVQVFVSFHDDGSADFTVSMDDEDHKFSASHNGDTAEVSYEETLTWRGQIRVAEPHEHVFKSLIASDEMTQYLEREDLGAVRRIRR